MPSKAMSKNKIKIPQQNTTDSSEDKGEISSDNSALTSKLSVSDKEI